MTFKSSTNSYLGINIGSSSIKIVELKNNNNKLNLLTYGFSENVFNENNDLHKSREYAIGILQEILKKAKIKSRNAVVSLPTSSIFSSIISLPNIEENEIALAVEAQAKKIIPLPIEEMEIDWKKISSDKNDIKILLTCAPKTLIKQYVDIISEAGINLMSIETEIFALTKALIGNDQSSIMIVEIGANTTDIFIIFQGVPVLSRSINVGGFLITKAISSVLQINIHRAEQFKYDASIESLQSNKNIPAEIIIETINPIINEIKYMLRLFQDRNNKTVNKIILSGGSSFIPNFTNYLSKILNVNVVIGDPWFRINYPVELKPILFEIGPRLSVAIGLAMTHE